MADNHTVTAFDDELKEVGRLVAEIGGLAEQQIERGMAALTRGDTGDGACEVVYVCAISRE